MTAQMLKISDARSRPKTPIEVKNAFVRRHLVDHEPVIMLAKEADVSVPAFYVWINNYKAQFAELAKRAAMSEEDKLASDNLSLRIEVERQQKEIKALKETIVKLVMKYDPEKLLA